MRYPFTLYFPLESDGCLEVKEAALATGGELQRLSYRSWLNEAIACNGIASKACENLVLPVSIHPKTLAPIFSLPLRKVTSTQKQLA